MKANGIPSSRRSSILPIVLLVLYAVFLVTFYDLVVIPLALDLSYIGFLMIGAGAVISWFAIPKAWRRTFSLLTLLILLLCYGVNSIYSDSLAWRFVEFPVMFAILGWIASRYAKIRWKYTLTLLVSVAVLLAVIPLGSMPFYSKFGIAAKSDQLDARPLFPLYPLVNKGNAIYSLGDLPKTDEQDTLQEDEQQLEQVKKGTNASSTLRDWFSRLFGKKPVDPNAVAARVKKQLENVDVLRFTPDTGYKKEPATQAEVASLPFSSLGLAGFPYYSSSWSVENGVVKQHFTPVDDPKQVLTSFFDPLSITVAMDERAARSVKESRNNWNHMFGQHTNVEIPGSIIIGQGKFLPGTGTQLVIEGANELKLVDASHPDGPAITTWKGTWVEPLTSDLIIADIDGDGLDELLINTTPAKILKLKPDHTWETLWQSGLAKEKDSFRFEFVSRDPYLKKPVIIANDPSLIRDVNTRYLTAYTYDNGQLNRVWRMYKENIVFPHPISADLWVTQLYGTQQFFVLKSLPYPVVPVLVGLYGLLVLAGYGYQWVQRGKGRHA
jgi:hypothetical protein